VKKEREIFSLSIRGRPNTNPARKQKNIDWFCQTARAQQAAIEPRLALEITAILLCPAAQRCGAEPCVCDDDLAENTVKNIYFSILWTLFHPILTLTVEDGQN